jgi:hypothetical protein
VKIQMQRVTESPKHKFTMATLLKKEGNTAKLTIIKKERAPCRRIIRMRTTKYANSTLHVSLDIFGVT